MHRKVIARHMNVSGAEPVAVSRRTSVPGCRLLAVPTGSRSGNVCVMKELITAGILLACGTAVSEGLVTTQGQGLHIAEAPAAGIDEVQRIEALPLLRYGSLGKQLSSHDKTGGNNDGYYGGTQLYVDDRGEYVVFDAFGPGCLHRMWFASREVVSSRIRVYVDDLEEPVVDSPFLAFFQGMVAPFVSPLVCPPSESSGGFISYVPICFEERAKVTLSRSPEYFNSTYRLYDGDQVVRSFSGEEDYSRLMDQWNAMGQDPKCEYPTRRGTGEVRIGGGELKTLFAESGAGAVWSLRISVPEYEYGSETDLWILAWWDKHEEPDIFAPIPDFFGAQEPGHSNRGLLLGEVDEEYYCFLPMPYHRSAQVGIWNRGAQQLSVQFSYEIAEGAYPSSAAYLRTQYRSVEKTLLGQDYIIADQSGSGHYVGVIYTALGPGSNRYLEGDERFYLDDSRSPQIYGTGTEDYFNAGWYFRFGAFSLPLHGGPFVCVPERSRSRTGCRRMHVGDLLPFFRSARLGIEHDGFNDNIDDALWSVAFFYHRSEVLLVKTDHLELGSESSETEHGYRDHSRDLSEACELVSFYEGDNDDVPFVDRGYACRASVSFNVKIHPGNNGVLLRRRLDQQRGRQLSCVYVDDLLGARWYDVFENGQLRWADSDLLLPASLTQGKSSLFLRIVNEGDVPWTAYSYDVFCYLPAPEFSEADGIE